MSRQYNITTVKELAAAATKDNLDVLMADLRSWLEMEIASRPFKPELRFNDSLFTWNDDGKTGLAGIHIIIDGK